MSAHNFRQILDVSPDGGSFTCVGRSKNNTRCTQKLFSHSDLSEASNLLNKMDRSKDLSISYQYVEDLACLTLCPRWHRKPEYSQVNAVSNRWRRAISQYESATKKASTLRTKQVLEKRTTEKVYTENKDSQGSRQASTVNLRNPNVLKERQANLPLSKTASTTRSKANDDPFTTNTSLAPTSKAPPEERFSFSSQPSFGRPAQPVFFSQPPLTTGGSNAEQETVNKHPSVPLNFSFPPTPPATFEDLEQESKPENEELPSTPTKASSSKESIPRRSLTIPRTFTSTKNKTETKTSVEPRAVISSDLGFGSQYSIPSKPSDVETPTNTSALQLPEVPLSIWDTTDPDPREEAPEGNLISAQTILSPETPVKTASIINKDVFNALEKHAPTNEESFGYAIVTPESKRFTTYLPARHQYGIMTPPDTPDTSADDLEIKTDSLQGSFPGFSVRPVISRRPLPTLQARNHVVCMECGNGHDGGHCTCVEMGDDESVKAGCFHRFGLRRLKSKFVTKVDAYRTRVFRTKVEKHKS